MKAYFEVDNGVSKSKCFQVKALQWNAYDYVTSCHHGRHWNVPELDSVNSEIELSVICRLET